jgi:drug/metabolite transporter (DMT)-like permease
MQPDPARLRLKTWLCATIVVLSNVVGNLFLKRGMAASISSPIEYITVLFRPWVAAGVLLLILWMLSRMALLSWADLSYVLPVTAIGYVLVAFSGAYFLHEQINARRWSGIVLIVAGVVLVGGTTEPNTAPTSAPETAAPQARAAGAKP